MGAAALAYLGGAGGGDRGQACLFLALAKGLHQPLLGLLGSTDLALAGDLPKSPSPARLGCPLLKLGGLRESQAIATRVRGGKFFAASKPAMGKSVAARLERKEKACGMRLPPRTSP